MSFFYLKHVTFFVCQYCGFLVSEKHPQEADVVMFDVARFEGVPNRFVGDRVERLREVDCCDPHFDSPLVAFLINHCVRRKMVCCLVRASESRRIFCLDLVKSWVQSAVQYCREQFVQRWQGAYRVVVSSIFHVSFFYVSLLFSLFAMPQE